MSDRDAQLRATLQGGAGLPGEFFRSEEIFALERERIFTPTWVCIGLAQDVAARGDMHPVSVLGLPLVMVREQQEILVFHNVCSHRGAELVRAAVRGRVRIVCPYHSWTYALDGRLLRTPHAGGAGVDTCPAWSTADLHLREVRSAVWAQHVFVNLSGDAPPFEEWIRPTAERLGAFDWSLPERDPELSSRLEVAANWKTIAENFVESYHLPWVHRELNSINAMERHYQILGGHAYLGQGGSAYEGDRLYGDALPVFPSLAGANAYEALYIFPNLIIGPLPDFGFSIIIEPVSAGLTRERVEFVFAGQNALRQDLAAARRARAEFLLSVNREDVDIVESVQRGRSSPAFVGGRFSPAQERTSLQLQQVVAARLLATAGTDPRTLVDLPVCDIPHPQCSTATS